FLFAETCAATHNKCRSLSSGAAVSRAWQVAERHTAWHGGGMRTCITQCLDCDALSKHACVLRKTRVSACLKRWPAVSISFRFLRVNVTSATVKKLLRCIVDTLQNSCYPFAPR